jgi:hypothetical protein
MKNIHARAGGRVFYGLAQVLRIVVNPALLKVFTAAAGDVHGVWIVPGLGKRQKTLRKAERLSAGDQRHETRA